MENKNLVDIYSFRYSLFYSINVFATAWYGSTNPKDIGFWYAFYIAFITGIPVTYYIIKWRVTQEDNGCVDEEK